MAEKKIPFRLKGHEKFVLHDGWLNKGLQAVNNDERIFLGNNAPDELGVGNNMVKSIRYWLKAFKLIHEKPGKGAYLTPLADEILDHDKYFENDFTLWVLHSNLVRNIEEATTWYMVFNRCDAEEFNKEELKDIITSEIIKYVKHSNFSKLSVNNDIEVLLNMYCKEKGEDYDPEDKNVCPLSALSLIFKKNDIYIRRQPDIRKLSEWVILYELLNLFKDNKSISIDAISQGERSIGNIYNLSRVTINEYLDKLENMNFIRVIRTAGLDVVMKETDMTAEKVIDEYYKNHQMR